MTIYNILEIRVPIFKRFPCIYYAGITLRDGGDIRIEVNNFGSLEYILFNRKYLPDVVDALFQALDMHYGYRTDKQGMQEHRRPLVTIYVDRAVKFNIFAGHVKYTTIEIVSDKSRSVDINRKHLNKIIQVLIGISERLNNNEFPELLPESHNSKQFMLDRDLNLD